MVHDFVLAVSKLFRTAEQHQFKMTFWNACLASTIHLADVMQECPLDLPGTCTRSMDCVLSNFGRALGASANRPSQQRDGAEHN